MPSDLSNMVEPVADPTAKPVKKSKKSDPSPLAELPQTKIEEAPKKVSPRSMWEVSIKVNGVEYGPFSQEAVDESEAIQRVLDLQAPQLKSQMVSAKPTVKPIGNAA